MEHIFKKTGYDADSQHRHLPMVMIIISFKEIFKAE